MDFGFGLVLSTFIVCWPRLHLFFIYQEIDQQGVEVGKPKMGIKDLIRPPISVGEQMGTQTHRGADQFFYAHLGIPFLYSLLVYFLVYIQQMEAGPTNSKSGKYQAENKINTVQNSRNAIRELSPKQINQPQMRWGLAPAGS